MTSDSTANAGTGTGDDGCWPPGRRPRVGDTASRTRTVLLEDIELFTRMTGDANPLHVDEEFAAASPFGRIIVQGGVTSGLLNAVVAEDLPGPGSVFLSVAWDFVAAVGPGDVLTAEVEVTSARTDKPVTELVTTVRRDDEDVLRGTAVCFTVLS